MIMGSLKQLVAPLLGAAVLLAIGLTLHHTGSSNAAWTGDDGHLLYTATTFSPLDFFFVPKYTHEASPNDFVTPFLPFAYFVNVRLFGLSPALHYTTMFVGIVLATYAVYRCARLWLPRFFAFMAAELFLAGRPTLLTSASLMNSHYLWGAVRSQQNERICPALAWRGATRERPRGPRDLVVRREPTLTPTSRRGYCLGQRSHGEVEERRNSHRKGALSAPYGRKGLVG